MSHTDYKHIGEPEDRIIEEIGEFLQALGKAKRFGWFSYHPDRPESTNMEEVKAEMHDIVEVFEKLEVKMRFINTKHYEEERENE